MHRTTNRTLSTLAIAVGAGLLLHDAAEAGGPPVAGCAPAPRITIPAALKALRSVTYPARRPGVRPDVLRERRLIAAFERRSAAEERAAIPALIAMLEDSTQVWTGVPACGYPVLEVRHRAVGALQRLTLRSFGDFAHYRGGRVAPGTHERQAAAEAATVRSWKAWWAKHRGADFAALRAARVSALIKDLSDKAKAPAAALALVTHAGGVRPTDADWSALRKRASDPTARTVEAALRLGRLAEIVGGRPQRSSNAPATAADVAVTPSTPTPLRRELVLRLLETGAQRLLWGSLRALSARIPATKPGGRLNPSARAFFEVSRTAAGALRLNAIDLSVRTPSQRRAVLTALQAARS